MKFEVFNVVFFEKEKLQKILEKLFPEKKEMTVNVIFVSEKKIRELNRDFRGKDEVTDVLSFEISDSIGEVYVCSEYIKEEKEVVRMIIHGVLHIQDYDHEGYFDEKSINEEMFEKQERLLKDFYGILEK